VAARCDDAVSSSRAADVAVTAVSVTTFAGRHRRRRNDSNHLLPGLLQPAALLAVDQLAHHVDRLQLRAHVPGDWQVPAWKLCPPEGQLLERHEEALCMPLYVNADQTNHL